MRNEVGGNSVSTVVLRGSTDSILDDLERAVDDGVNTFKVLSYILLIDFFSLNHSLLTHFQPSVGSSFCAFNESFLLFTYNSC